MGITKSMEDQISSEEIDGLDGAFNCESRDWMCLNLKWFERVLQCDIIYERRVGMEGDLLKTSRHQFKSTVCLLILLFRVALRGSESKAWRWQWSQLDKNHTALMRVHATIDILIELLLTVEPLGGCLEPVNRPPNSMLTGCASELQFHCLNLNCVDGVLRCNSVNDCGD